MLQFIQNLGPPTKDSSYLWTPAPLLRDIYKRRPLRYGFKPTETFISQTATTLGNPDPSAVPSLSQGEILSTKQHPGLTHLSGQDQPEVELKEIKAGECV